MDANSYYDSAGFIHNYFSCIEQGLVTYTKFTFIFCWYIFWLFIEFCGFLHHYIYKKNLISSKLHLRTKLIRDWLYCTVAFRNFDSLAAMKMMIYLKYCTVTMQVMFQWFARLFCNKGHKRLRVNYIQPIISIVTK